MMTDLGTLGGNYSQAGGINNNGQIVGESENATGYYHAFLWQNGIMTDLETLGGNYSGAFGINNNGQMVGASTNATEEIHAALWAVTSLAITNQLMFKSTNLLPCLPYQA
jgi:probable HAF family extracellular repeat protein